jgi:catechol 2,3-dioxygenase-like lactoylglutathione lyase family enzyme
MDMKLEVVVVPVSDVDRTKQFYESLGFRLDVDRVIGDDRVVQFTPPGSLASIHIGKGITTAAPGSAGSLMLAVSDVEAARKDLIRRGADVSEVFHAVGGSYHRPATRVTGPDPERRSYF